MVLLDLMEGRVGRCWSRWQLAVGRGCSWDDGVGLSLLGSVPVDGSL